MGVRALSSVLPVVVLGLLLAHGTAAEAQQDDLPQAPQSAAQPLPAKTPKQQQRETAAVDIPDLPIVNHRPYQPPTQAELRRAYFHDTYGPLGIASTTIRALYAQARGKPTGWGTDFPGFAQRFGSSAGVTAINGSVRYGMEELFHEDLRYIPCHGCNAKHKIENALLAEITARHQADGHRVFSLTPTISDFSGPIISHTVWYPGKSSGPLNGVISARVVFPTRVGVHLFQEFVMERRHKDVRE